MPPFATQPVLAPTPLCFHNVRLVEDMSYFFKSTKIIQCPTSYPKPKCSRMSIFTFESGGKLLNYFFLYSYKFIIPTSTWCFTK